MSDEAQRIQAAQDAETALKQHLAPAFEVVEGLYDERYSRVLDAEPWADEKLKALKQARLILRQVRSHIEAVVADGVVAEASSKHLRKIEQMSPQRRRILGL